MQIITYLTIGFILALANFIIFEDNKKITTFIKSLLIYIIAFNIMSLSILKYVLKKTLILLPESYTPALCIKYTAFSFILGFLVLILKGILNSKIRFEKIKFKFTKKAFFIKLVSIILFIIGVVFIFFSDWFIDYFGQITPEQFLFNLKSPLKGTSSDMSTEIFNTPVFAIVSSTILFILFISFSYDIYLKIKDTEKKVFSQKVFKIISNVLSLLVLVGGVTYGFNKLSLKKVIKAYFANSTYFEDNYVDPRETELTFPSKKRNLIHIYLESIESSYLSKELGGYMDDNLMPELTELAKEGIHFSNTDTFGGANQTYCSSWSVAGMVNMSTGIPLKIPMDGNSYGTQGYFLPGAVNLGDILDAQGYNQTVMFGADADFGGLTTFFTTHGNYNIFDVKAARNKGLIPQDYNVWWGFEDEKLYSFAKDELTRLYSEGKPFNFTMETADTHFPDGYLSEKNNVNKYSSQYANVIAYSTKETVEFINWIKQQPFYENTTIVLTGDHLSMDQKFFENFDPSYRRTTFNLILNAPITTDNTKNREFAPFDMFPTILASLGVDIEGNKLALGTNLFSNEKTLIEKDEIDNVNEQLESNSNFFNDEFINISKTSVFDNKLVKYKE